MTDDGNFEVWARPLISTMSGKVAVALLNRSDNTQTITFNLESVGLTATKGYVAHNLWDKADYDTSHAKTMSLKVPTHGVVVLKIEGTAKPFNVFQYK